MININFNVIGLTRTRVRTREVRIPDLLKLEMCALLIQPSRMIPRCEFSLAEVIVAQYGSSIPQPIISTHNFHSRVHTFFRLQSDSSCAPTCPHTITTHHLPSLQRILGQSDIVRQIIFISHIHFYIDNVSRIFEWRESCTEVD